MRVRKLAVIAPLLLASVALAGLAVRDASAQAAGGAAVSDSAAADRSSRRAAREPRVRSAWMIGAGGGYGVVDARFHFFKPGSEPGPTSNLRLGYAAHPRTVVGLEVAQWTAKPDTIRWTFTAVTPTVTWYSKGRGDNTNQMFLRLGAGWGHAEGGVAYKTGAVPLVVGRDSIITNRVKDDGFGLLGAIGYEWRFGRSYGLAPQLDVAFVNLARGDNALWGAASLQINRYW
jgi:hypothetical protein